jgi:hypothetical protein
MPEVSRPLDLQRAITFLERLPIRDRYSRRLIPFQLKHSQRKIVAAMQKCQDKKRPVRVIILKARRIGGSAITDGLGICHCAGSEAALALVVAHLYKSSKGLMEVPTNLVDKALPGKLTLKELINAAVTKHEIVFPRSTGDSVLSLATAGSVSGAGGRALAFTFLHLSEAAYFPGLQPFTSLLPTVPYDPATFVVIESTANGRVGPGASFYDYWQNAVSGQNDFEPVFVPWHDDPTYVRNPEDANDAPCDEYETWLMREFHCTKAQIAWWRATLETECKGVLSIMQQEYPASADEAFVVSGDPAFEREELEYVRGLLRDAETVGDIKCAEGTITNPFFEKYGTGHWLIYQMPIAGHKYYAGFDAARGMQIEEGETEPSPEGDFAAGVIWDGDTGELVARMAAKIPPETLARVANAAGRFYNNAMVNVELTGNLGLWAQVTLRDKYHYPLLYRWRGARDDHIGDSNKLHKRNALGWETTTRSRELMMDAYRAALRQGFCKPCDRSLCGQMELATRKEGFRWEVVRGHDDILMAAMIGWIAREQWGSSHINHQHKPSGSSLPSEEGNIPGVRQDTDVALQLARHVHKLNFYNKRKDSGKTDPLAGI